MLDEGERLSSKVYSKIMVEHLHRYAFAREYVTDKIVLDIASGEGYGTNLLSTNAKFAYGVDLSEDAVKHAGERYGDVNKKFLTGNVIQIPLADDEVNVVVSFETIEHVHEHDKMLSECKRVMKEEGMLIISTPDKRIYSDIPGYKNPFHVKELYEHEFIDLASRYFSNIVLYKQGIVKGGVIYPCDKASNNGLRVYRGDYEKVTSQSDVESAEYMIIVASNVPVVPCKNSFFESSAVDSKLLQELSVYKKKYDAIYNSTSYKLGKSFLAPFQKIKSLFHN
jgi:ubiquinone/menaquinone biosynthesis C-methylase UbiE